MRQAVRAILFQKNLLLEKSGISGMILIFLIRYAEAASFWRLNVTALILYAPRPSRPQAVTR